MNILPPPNFIDPHPERGSWYDPAIKRPGVFIYVETLHADGSSGQAVWTGNLWWHKGVVTPLGWRTLLPSGNSLKSNPPTNA